MENLNVKIKFKDLKAYLYELDERNIRELLNQYAVEPKRFGRENFYLIEEIKSIKLEIKQRYEFNKVNRIETKELLALDIHNPSTLFEKIKKQPLDRIYEFKYKSYFYDKQDVKVFLSERQIIKNSLNIEGIKVELGLSHFDAAKRIIELNKLTPIKLKYFKAINYYKRDDIEAIKKKMDERYKFNKDNRLTYTQITEKYKLTSSQISKLTAMRTTVLDRLHEYSKCNFFYKKNEVLDFVNKITINSATYSSKEVKDILAIQKSTSFYRYLNRLNILPISIEGESKLKWDKNEIDELVVRTKLLMDIYEKKFIRTKDFESFFNTRFEGVKRAFERINEKIKYYQVPNELRLGQSGDFERKALLIALEDLDYILEVFTNSTKVANIDEIKNKRDVFFKGIDKNFINLDSEREMGIVFPLIDIDTEELKDFSKHLKISNVDELKREILELTMSEEWNNQSIITKNQISKKYNISYLLLENLIDSNKQQIKSIKYTPFTFYSFKEIDFLFNKLVDEQKKY